LKLKNKELMKLNETLKIKVAERTRELYEIKYQIIYFTLFIYYNNFIYLILKIVVDIMKKI